MEMSSAGAGAGVRVWLPLGVLLALGVTLQVYSAPVPEPASHRNERHAEDSSTPPSLELGTLTPAFIAAAFITTMVLFLAGCTTCCRYFKQSNASNACHDYAPEIVEMPPSAQYSGIVDTGIVNPISEREFTIFAPLGVAGSPRSRGTPDVAADPYPYFVPPIGENNNPQFEDNNNGPISPQELENIVNNNAENYIVSEYENRNLNAEPNPEVVLPEIQEVVIVPQQHSSPINQPPMEQNIFTEYADWFNNTQAEIPRNHLHYIREIGRGWFGRIVEADTIEGSNLEPKIAVKILNGNVSLNDKRTFLDEIRLYRDVKHDNILKFLGKNLNQDPWIVLFEYCALGDLKQFLLENNTNSSPFYNKLLPLKFQCELSSAIAYLHSQNIVHPDIACHSCLVNEGPNLRLGDYGNSKQKHPNDYYMIELGNFVPLRWLPPESLRSNPTIEGNVWSLGVFLWECISWGRLPHDNFTDEEVILNVLLKKSARLTLPASKSNWETHLYTLLQACLQYESSKRCTSFQVFSYLRQIYSLYFDAGSVESDEDFDVRWQKLKSNSIPKIDNGLPFSIPSPTENYKYYNGPIEDTQNMKGNNSLRQYLEPSDTTSDDGQLKDVKSESLNNLHGSFESVRERGLTNSDVNSDVISTNPFISHTYNDISHLDDNSKSPIKSKDGVETALWHQNVRFPSEEYMKKVNDVISDLDNMLSSEKTSSSESSHEASPLRDMSVVSVSKKNTTEATQSAPANVDALSENVISDNKTENVPAPCEDQPQPLDFRINDGEVQRRVPAMFETKLSTNGNDLDSLQDSSYIPNELKTDGKTDNETDVWTVKRQSSSGSETDDEIWKKRIEMGTITEKIKSKSKSVTDLMVLTHIDIDFTDMESDEASLTSFDFRNSFFSNRKSANDSKESSLPVDQYLSLRQNMISIFNSNLDPTKNTVDIEKLKSQCKSAYMNILRPSKSFDDIKDLNYAEAKSKIQPFLDRKTQKSLFEYDTPRLDSDPFAQNCPRSFEIFNNLQNSSKANESLYFPSTNYSIRGDFSEEEQLQFSSNFNDINLNLYAAEKRKNFEKEDTINESVNSTIYINPPEKISIDKIVPGTIIKSKLLTENNVTPPQDWTAEVISNFIKSEREQSKDVKTSTPQGQVSETEVSDNAQALAINISPIVNEEDKGDKAESNDEKHVCVENIRAVNFISGNELLDELIDANLINITSKLAIAENENNLNLEINNPTEVGDDDYNEYNELLRVESLIDTIIMTSRDMAQPENQQMGASLDSSLEELPAAEYIEEVHEDDEMPNYPPPPPQLRENYSGWFLHPKCESPEDIFHEESEKVDIVPSNIIKGLDVCNAIIMSNGDSTESLTENSTSDHINVDPESVQALRNELELKLPLAQKINQMGHDSAKETEHPDDAVNNFSMCRKCPDDQNEPECLTDIQPETSKQPVREEVIHYVVPLSPIQEESWSEFSEIEKAADDKTDISTSLSLHLVNEVCDAVNATLVNQLDKKSKMNEEDESDTSNRTFILCEDIPDNHNLNRRKSLSADSLNDVDGNLDLDDDDEDNEVTKNPKASTENVCLLSSHVEDRSKNMSTEEICHHVDDLLESISKTLETASKVNTNFQKEELIEEISELSLKDDSGSATYVIEDKKPTVENLTNVFNIKVSELPDDISNVSKVSQPSLVSDVVTSNESDCNAKNSEKSMSQNLHTKTPSIGSWCSNDTLFNVEENFDDVCYDFTPSSGHSKNSTPVPDHKDDDDSVSETTPKAVDVPVNCAGAYAMVNGNHETQTEVMVGQSENILHNISSPEFITSDNDDTKQSPSINSSVNAKSPSLSFEKYQLPDLPLDSTKSTDSPTIFFSAKSSKASDNDNEISSLAGSEVYQTAFTDMSESSMMYTCLEQLPKSIETSDNDLQTPTAPETTILESPESVMNQNNSLLYNNTFKHLGDNKASTPLENDHEMCKDSLDLAGNLIDEHFKFLNSLDSPSTLGDSLTMDNENVQEVDKLNIKNAVSSFLEHEVIHNSKPSTAEPKENSLFSNSIPSSENLSSESTEIIGKKLQFSDCDESNPEKQNISSSTPEAGLSQNQENFLGLHSNSANSIDGHTSALAEYAEYTGMNMDFLQSKLQNDDPVKDCSTFEVFIQSVDNAPQDLDKPSDDKSKSDTSASSLPSFNFSNLEFSGPSDKNQSLETSGIQYIEKLEDIINIPPELLKDWDSGSDDSNCNSTSSGEFIWKEGDKEQSVSVTPAIFYQTPPSATQKTKFQDEGVPEPIAEEVASPSADSAGEDEDLDFTPSRWDCLAIPGKSSLKISGPSPNDKRKKVGFDEFYKIYEYPRGETPTECPEVSNYASYNDWQTYDRNYDSFMDPENIIESMDGDFSQSYDNAIPPGSDFFISSSARPFESFDLSGSSSQFFPGYRMSDNEDFESLPIVPSAVVEEVTNIDEVDGNLTDLNNPTQGFITPDSGTEDMTPASLLDEFSSDDGLTDNMDKDDDKDATFVEKEKNLINKKDLQLKYFKNSPTRSPSESTTPSTPSPSIQSSNSSGSLSPLNLQSPNTLGGLRHTRGNLKLDLPPSPLTRNPPSITSGRSADKDMKIFDFKNIPPPIIDTSKLDNEEVNLDVTLKDETDKSTLNNGDSESSLMEESESLKEKTKDDQSLISPEDTGSSSDLLSADLESNTLQKVVIPLNGDDSKKVTLEAVKGEGTLLDSGDEDSGIGNSAHASLERKLEIKRVDIEARHATH